jgi:hypothetical protein
VNIRPLIVLRVGTIGRIEHLLRTLSAYRADKRRYVHSAEVGTMRYTLGGGAGGTQGFG